MPSNAQRSPIAAALLEAHSTRRPFFAAPDGAPADSAAAYRVQDEIAAALYPRQRAAAWKVGAPRRDAEPSASPIHPPRVLASPARWTQAPVTGLAIEGEIAFRVARDIAPADATRVRFDEAFDQALVTIELCDARLANHREASALWKLADSQVNAGLVIGSGCPVSAIGDYTALRCEVLVDGNPVFAETGRHPLGDPRVLLPWWLAHAARRGGLRTGDVVTAGSWCGMLPANAGSEVVVRFAGVGEAAVRFDF